MIDDWHYISLIFDRLLLYVYGIVTVIGTLAILMYAPHIFTDFDQKAYKEKNAIERCCKENVNVTELEACYSNPASVKCYI